MAKGGRAPAAASSGNGGIMGSGIFGMFGTTVQCKADDNSAFCMLSKTVNVIIMIGFLIFVLYIIYMAFKYFTGSKPAMGSPQGMTGGYISGSTSRYRRRSRSNKY